LFEEAMMAECGICGQDKPAERTRQVYTAIQQQSKRKSGFKEYEIKTQYHGFNDHIYSICADCIRRYRRYSLLLWLPACFVIAPLLMWLLFPEGQGQGSATEVLCFASALSPLLPLLLAFWIWSEFLNLNRKLVKKAVAAREVTNWRDDVGGPSYLRQDIKAEKYIGIQGFTEVEFKRLQRNR
jgi:hypothetical protein